MGSHWTDKSAILRDLSVAQGSRVPGGIDSAVAGVKPPMHDIKEETEEEYYRQGTPLEAGDFSSGPDLFKIKKMLELMQDEDAPNEEMLSEISTPIEITKLHAVPQFVPKHKKHAKENVDPIRKPRRARNVAIASIMALANQMSHEPLKLAKPEDFIKPIIKEDKELKERRKNSVNKVNNWLQSQELTSMFKRKSTQSPEQSNSAKESLKSQVLSEQSVKSSGTPKLPMWDGPLQFKVNSQNGNIPSESIQSPEGLKVKAVNMNVYTPSAWAEEYYKKAVDRSLMRDLIRDDVWSRAEKIMKEIDAQKEEQRKQEEAAVQAESSAGDAPAPARAAEDAEWAGIAGILLSKSRHELHPAADCVVCRVLAAPRGKGPDHKRDEEMGPDHRHDQYDEETGTDHKHDQYDEETGADHKHNQYDEETGPDHKHDQYDEETGPDHKHDQYDEETGPDHKHDQYDEETGADHKHDQYDEETGADHKHDQYDEETGADHKHDQYDEEKLPGYRHDQYNEKKIPGYKHDQYDEEIGPNHNEEYDEPTSSDWSN